MREKGQTEVAKTLETPVFSRGIENLTEKIKLSLKKHIPYARLFAIVRIIAHQCLKKFVDSKNAALEKRPKCLNFSNRTFFC